MITNVEYSKEVSKKVISELIHYDVKPLNWERNHKMYKTFVKEEGGINWEAVEKIAPRITEKSKKEYFQKYMNSSLAIETEMLFDACANAKSMEITDKVFSGLTWP